VRARRGDRWTYLTPKIRLDREEMESLLVNHDYALNKSGLIIGLSKNSATTMIDGQLAGWGGRVPLQAEVRTLLHLVDAERSAIAGEALCES